MESSQNENVILINDEIEICFNEWNIQDKILNGIIRIEQKKIKK
jgi:hypothetical protein